MNAESTREALDVASLAGDILLASGAEILSLVPSHHNHAIGERIGIRLDVDHVVAFRTEIPNVQVVSFHR